MIKRFKEDKVKYVGFILLGAITLATVILIILTVMSMVTDENDYNNSQVVGYLDLEVINKTSETKTTVRVIPTTTTTIVNGQAVATTTTVTVPYTYTEYTTIMQDSNGASQYTTTNEYLYSSVFTGDSISLEVKQTKDGSKTFYSYLAERIDLTKIGSQ